MAAWLHQQCSAGPNFEEQAQIMVIIIWLHKLWLCHDMRYAAHALMRFLAPERRC